jgi:hypothetical protein
MEGSMALLWINMWIGHVTQTKHRDSRLEYREKAKCKIGREKRARLSNQK